MAVRLEILPTDFDKSIQRSNQCLVVGKSEAGGNLLLPYVIEFSCNVVTKMLYMLSDATDTHLGRITACRQGRYPFTHLTHESIIKPVTMLLHEFQGSLLFSDSLQFIIQIDIDKISDALDSARKVEFHMFKRH